MTLAALVLAMAAPGARAATPAKAPPAHATPAALSPPRAPTAPPLSTGGSALSPEAEASASAPPSGGDPLVDNGLGSPLCRGSAGAELSAIVARNCRISGFDAAQAPTGDYAFDVHIDTGVLGANGATLEQDYLISPVWMALVWVVHALIVMLEWCYTIDLLESPAMSGVARGLRGAQATFTQPWLMTALALAGVLTLYNGLVRRRVAETLGQALLMGVMMVAGLWVIVDPTGTVGALGQWANQASLGTLAAVTTGTPAHPNLTLTESMQGVFTGVIGAPWCYMEFGDVRWCEAPVRSGSPLRAAARQIVAGYGGAIGNQSAELLRDAHTNGELFLALPANGQPRNGINPYGPLDSQDGLFNVLCGGSSEPCHGPTAGEAEFRTASGTQARLGGVFLIAIGALGMILLLGFIALHLLGAAIMSLLYLLLAPAAVIAPALGDGGRAAFRGWASRLLGAVMAKLIYSLLLGVVLLTGQILMDVPALGWWTKWLLMSVLWWGAFRHRHQVLGFAHGTGAGSREGIGGLRLASKLMAARELGRVGSKVARRLSPGPPNAEKRERIAAAAQGRAEEIADKRAGASLEHDHREAQIRVRDAPAVQARIADKRTRLARLQGEQDAARARAAAAKSVREALYDPSTLMVSAADRSRIAARSRAEERSHQQRAVKLQGRMDRLRGEVASEQDSLTAARRTVTDGERAKRASGKVYTSQQLQERVRLLDAQAALPDRGRAGPGGARRDYAAVAGVAGYAPRELEALDDHHKRAARLEIDRELARYKELNATARDVAGGAGGSLGRRDQRRTDKQFDRRHEQRVRDSGNQMPSSARPKPSALDAYLEDSRAYTRAHGESSVMRDAHEVAARRKRQLGRDRR
jgi:hypothetical protein